MILIESYNNNLDCSFISKHKDFFLDHKIEPKALESYAKMNDKLVKVARVTRDTTNTIGMIIGYLNSKEKGSILALIIENEYRNKKIGNLLVNELISGYHSINWVVRLKSVDFHSIPFFIKNHFVIMEELNLYKKSNLNFHLRGVFNNIRIEKASNSSLRQIIEIEKQSFDNYWHKHSDEWKNILKDKHSIVFIAVISNNKIIGFSYNSITTSTGSKEIIGQYIRIAVDPEYRQQKIASLLTYQAFEWFKQHSADKVYLSTIKDNKKLNKMYKSWGFILFDKEVILQRMSGVTT